MGGKIAAIRRHPLAAACLLAVTCPLPGRFVRGPVRAAGYPESPESWKLIPCTDWNRCRHCCSCARLASLAWSVR